MALTIFLGKRRSVKKGQMQISETIAVLFIFFVLVLFGLIFYFKYTQVSLRQHQEDLLGKRAMEVTLKTLYLPELVCSKGKAEPEPYCMDLAKLDSAPELIKTNSEDYYFGIFSYGKITIEEIYPNVDIIDPSNGPPNKWIIYDKPKLDMATVNVEPSLFIVTLKDDIGKIAEYRYGVVKVEVYS